MHLLAQQMLVHFNIEKCMHWQSTLVLTICILISTVDLNFPSDSPVILHKAGLAEQ